MWSECFGDVVGNRTAILERGWGPLNRGCLVHPDIAKTRLPTSQSNQLSQSSQLSARSEIVEEQLNRDPNHCSDMNPSHPKAFQLLHRLQKSLNRKIGVEKNHIEEMEATRVERDNNKLNGLITCRATA